MGVEDRITVTVYKLDPITPDFLGRKRFKFTRNGDGRRRDRRWLHPVSEAAVLAGIRSRSVKSRLSGFGVRRQPPGDPPVGQHQAVVDSVLKATDETVICITNVEASTVTELVLMVTPPNRV